MHEGSLFSTPPAAFVICGLINDGHSDWCEVVPHGNFDLISLIIRVLSIFSCACWLSVYLPWRNVYSGLLPVFFFSWVVGFFAVELYKLLVYFRDEVLVSCII